MTGRQLVTGGAGFLGSHLTESLTESGHDVVVIDNFGSGRRHNVASFRESVTVFEHDIRDRLPSVGSVDTIYHFASRASPTDFADHAVGIAETNTIGTNNILTLAAECDATVILASTSEVYGDPEVHPQPESYRGNVTPRGPRAPYNEAKRFMEALGTAYHTQHNLDVRTVRIFNTYGPRMRPGDGRVVPNFINQALSGEALTVHGSGEQTRSFCYVDDLIRGIRSVRNCPGLIGGVVNLGSTTEIAINELASIVVNLTDTGSSIHHTGPRVDDPEVRCPDIGKAKRQLDWTPDVSLRDGLRKTINYYKRERGDRGA